MNDTLNPTTATALRALATTPPPAQANRRPWKFHNIARANEEILRLETELAAVRRGGVAAQPMPLRATASPGTVAAPSSPVTTATLASIATELFGRDRVPASSVAEPERRQALAKLFYQAHLSYRGCEGDFATLTCWRMPDDRHGGHERAVAAILQDKVNRLLEGKAV